MATKTITERVSAPFSGSQVDRDAGVIRGVKLCGATSANGRDYPPAVFRAGIAKYENAPVYADHAAARGVRDKLGWIAAPRVDADGTPRGDFHVLKAHDLFPAVMEAAERNPALFGFSHVAVCETTPAGGRERIESIRSVESVDLVAEPATTAGLFESKHKGGRGVAVTVKEYLDKLAPRLGVAALLKARRLTEDDGYAGAEMPGTAPDPAADGGEDDAIAAGFEAAGTAVVRAFLAGEIDYEDAMDKIAALFDAFDGGGESGGGESDAEDDDPEPAEESRRREAVGDGSSAQKAQQRAMNAKDPKAHDKDGDHIGYHRRGLKKRRGKRRSSEAVGAGTERAAGGAAVREAIDLFGRIGFKGFTADDLDAVTYAPADRREAIAKRLMGSAGGGRTGEERPTSRTQKTHEAVGAGAGKGGAAAADGWQD